MGLRYDVERISNVRHYDAPTDTNNLQPRLGVAWEAIPGPQVVRGGVGLYTQQHLLGYINRVQLEGADGATPVVAGARVAGHARRSRDPVARRSSGAAAARHPGRSIRTFRNPYSMQATIGAEHSLFGMVVGTDFVYLRGFDLMSLVDTNAPASISKLSARDPWPRPT